MFIQNDYSDSMIDCLNYIDSFFIFENGKRKEIKKANVEFDIIYNKIENLFYNSHLMPAFGVSLHNETLNAIKCESWLQINFSKEMIKNDLPFNALIFKLEETSGINLIRLHNKKYDGRCIYLDFNEKTDLIKLLKELF